MMTQVVGNENHLKMSKVRQKFHIECEVAVNKQINMELYADHVYLSMAYYFDRDDVALKGFHVYFKKASDGERDRAEKLMKYLNKRGGRIALTDILRPPRDEWKSPEEAVSAALQLEKDVNASLLRLRGVAGEHNDADLCDFLEKDYFQEQSDSIKSLVGLRTNVHRVGEGLGIFFLDKELANMSI